MKKILLATDGSEGAAQAVELLTRLPLAENAKVEVLHVTEQAATFFGGTDIQPEDQEAFEGITAALEEEATEIVQRAADRLTKPSWTVQTTTRTGVPAQEILRAAEDCDADVIVVGATGLHGDPRTQLGKTARRLLKQTSRGVLIARELESPKPRLDLLVPVDGSEGSKAAVEIARQLDPKDSRITILSVLTVATTLYRYDVVERMSATWRAHKAHVEQELEEIAETLRAKGADVETRVLDGGTDAADEVLEATRLLRPEITVVGRSGKGSFRRFVLGSVSETLAESAPGSVWIAGEVLSD